VAAQRKHLKKNVIHPKLSEPAAKSKVIARAVTLRRKGGGSGIASGTATGLPPPPALHPARILRLMQKLQLTVVFL
jgi:hypothetical protein